MSEDKTWEINNINDLDKVAETILELSKKGSEIHDHATVIALHGDLGSGKTTFTKHLAKLIGIQETITSPTFVIQKNFDVPTEYGEDADPFKKMIHIDTYRIDLQDELVKLGWEEIVSYRENLIVVEWPENITDILPENTINLHFKFIDETSRELILRQNG